MSDHTASDHTHGDHASPVTERRGDVAVIGSSKLGLAAVLQVLRRGGQRRSVIVVDAGEPEPPSAPAADTSTGREEVRSYGGEILAGRVVGLTRTNDGRFRIELVGGHAVFAGQVLAATGPTDEIPGIERLATSPGFHVPRDEADDANEGGRIAEEIIQHLVQDDTHVAARSSANQADWDNRYGGSQIWSGNPNGTLVKEITDLAPGRALDVGAGEGGDVLWLAEQGWRVTASDISTRALDRVSGEAERRGLHVERLHTDANAPEAFPAGAFDLVTAHYASIPRTPDDQGIHNLVNAVAPGGTLLFVSHDLEPMREPIDTQTHSRLFDPDAFVRVDDVVTTVAGSQAWDIQVHEKRPRPPGSASDSHHVDDVVLRSRRHPE